ncbi:hypothetical protein CSKR_107624 [Clonorchis sinensis]|uniref:Uncharacterized protein n=1 Tax=Clonorchis sinensis TaxID=79923 RepID=A0A3R7CBI4_CLOSI|nr:hypothetical protein CSKR_107624 [Clonorchis sinensis]
MPNGLLQSLEGNEWEVPQIPSVMVARWLKWLEREFTDRKVRGSNPTSASRLPLSRRGQPGSIPALMLPSGGLVARHRKGVTAEQYSDGCDPLLHQETGSG